MKTNSDTNENQNLMKIKALHLTSNAVLAEGTNGEEVIRLAEETGEDYILDFVNPEGTSFIY